MQTTTETQAASLLRKSLLTELKKGNAVKIRKFARQTTPCPCQFDGGRHVSATKKKQNAKIFWALRDVRILAFVGLPVGHADCLSLPGRIILTTINLSGAVSLGRAQ
jgi:hypothetical protein